MAISIVSGNLNTYGNTGSYESDPSTWGFGSTLIPGEHTRTSVKKKAGLYSHLFRALNVFENSEDPQVTDFSAIDAARLAFVAGKKYLIKVWVYSPTPIGDGYDSMASDSCQFWMRFPDGDRRETTSKVLVDAQSVWTELQFDFVAPSLASGNYNLLFGLCRGGTGLEINVFGYLFIDEFRVYEYIDVVEPCTLAIDVAGTTVVNETTPGANNGTITVAITGGTAPFEYSKNGGTTWQSSNLFTGLAPAVYNVVVREQTRISCASAQSFAVNAGSYTFSFTTSKSDESISGAADGSILITVTGTVAPFTFSKNGGGTYQSGNLFIGLAPGTYTIVVKSATGIMRAANVTIAPASLAFERVFWSKNPIILNKAAASGWEALTNYRLYDDVRVEENTGSSMFTSKLKVALYPSATGNCVFQVRQAFRGVLKAIPPAQNESNLVRLTDRIKAFKHYTGELQDEEVTPSLLTASLSSLVLLGGLNKATWPTTEFFGSYLATNKKFLTWAPITKVVDKMQEDYLNFFVYSADITLIKLKIKAYYDDATNATDTSATLAVSYGHLVQVPAGANCGVGLINPAKNLVKYEISLLNQADALVSEVRTYVLVDILPNIRYYLFLNSLGSYEVLRFNGLASTSVDIGKETVVKFLPYNYDPLDGEKQTNQSSLQEKASIGSGLIKGPLGKEWFDYLKDFLISTRVFDITDGVRRPVSISGGSYNMEADRDYERFIRFTQLDSFQDEVYTPAAI
jgi:hypothetical protein